MGCREDKKLNVVHLIFVIFRHHIHAKILLTHCQRREREREKERERERERERNVWSLFKPDFPNIRIYMKLKKKPESTFSPAWKIRFGNCMPTSAILCQHLHKLRQGQPPRGHGI